MAAVRRSQLNSPPSLLKRFIWTILEQLSLRSSPWPWGQRPQKLWKSGAARGRGLGRGLAPPRFWRSGVLPPENFLEILVQICVILVHLGKNMHLKQRHTLKRSLFTNGCAPAYLANDCRWIRHRQAGLRSSLDMIKLDLCCYQL